MIVDVDVICKVCKRVFCCAKCRHKHEIKNHALAVQNPLAKVLIANGVEIVENNTIYLMCPICEGKPLMMHNGIHPEMLEHVERSHLPLRCEKCEKIYTKIDDFSKLSKCLHLNNITDGNEDDTCDTETSKVTVTKAAVTQTTISTQTSPICKAKDTNLTPISIINLQWKAKTKMTQEEFISDSVSSIKNISSINNSSIQRSMNVAKGKLVRSTSTPVHAEMIFSKPKEQAFSASSGQVSSIYNSGCELDNSPALLNPCGTPPKQPLENFNRYLKVNSRAKMAKVTPLRQVMSKSIQKAFAEHGMPTAGMPVFNRKKMFDSNDSSLIVDPSTTANACLPLVNPPSTASIGSPLDLRLSPAVRRSKQKENCDPNKGKNSEFSNKQAPRVVTRDMLLSSKKLTTESIVITRTKRVSASFESKSCATTVPAMSATNQSTTSVGNASSSIYKTCVEIITSTEMSAVNIEQNELATEAEFEDNPNTTAPQDSDNNLDSATPITRIPGAMINKKLIKFETPTKETEVFFTPKSTAVRKRSFHRVSTEENYEECKRIVQSNFHLSTEEASADFRKSMQRFNLGERFSPQKRPALREYVKSVAYKRVDVDYNDDDDEVFLPTEDKEQEEKINTKQPVGRLWSLMSSVMQIGRTKSTDTDGKGSNSLIRRCASIAGSLVRAKPLIDAEQLKTLKRKRTNTMDNQTVYLSPNATDAGLADCSSGATKRFRIHGRKPIGRMRNNS